MSFRSIALVGFAPRSTLGRTVRDQLAQSLRIEDSPAKADVVLQALNDARERAAVVTTASGQVRELQLRARLTWRASTPRAAVLISPQELLLTRDEDMAMQIVRRLASLKLG